MKTLFFLKYAYPARILGGYLSLTVYAALACALAASGCVPSSIRPEAEYITPEELDPGKAMALKQDAAWPSEHWWLAYQDQQLARLVDKAVAQSPSLKIAAARVRNAEGAAKSAGSGRYPQLEASYHSDRTHYTELAYKPADLAGGYAWDNSALVSASFTIDLWGKERAAHEAGLDSLAASIAEARASALVLQTSVVRTYITLSKQYALLDIAKETQKQRESVLRIAKELYSAGIGTEFAVSQAETAIPSSRARVIEYETAITVTKQQLAALCGEGPGFASQIDKPTLAPADMPALPQQLPAELAGRRPDIVANRWRAEAAAQGIQVAKAAFYPNIDLTAAAGYLSIGFTKFISAEAGNAHAGPAVTLPIFQGGRLTGQLQSRTATYDEAVESYNQSVIEAFSAIAGQMTQLQALKAQAKEAAKSLSLAKKSYGIANKAYSAGLTDYLNVLTAENTLLAERENSAVIAAKQLDAYAALMYELGGGYKTPVERPVAPAPSHSQTVPDTPGTLTVPVRSTAPAISTVPVTPAGK